MLAAKAGDLKALEALITEDGPLRRMYRGLIRKLDPEKRADRWEPAPCHGMPNEAEAAAHLGVIEALRRYDPRRGVSFTTFAYPFIKRAILDALYGKTYQKAGQPVRLAMVAFEVPCAEEDERGMPGTEAELLASDPAYGAELGFFRLVKNDQQAEVRAFLAGLPQVQQEITRLHYFDELAPTDIATKRGTSRQAVSKTLTTVATRGREVLEPLAVAA